MFLKYKQRYQYYDQMMNRKIRTGFGTGLFDNIILHLAYEYPEKINWASISSNPNLTLEFIEKNIDKVNWQSLSRNPILTEEFIEKYEDRIDWIYLSTNSMLTEKIIDKYIDRLDLKNLSYNNSLTPEILEKYIDEKWDFGAIMEKKTTTLEFIDKHKDKFNFENITNPNLTLEYVKKNNLNLHDIIRYRMINQ